MVRAITVPERVRRCGLGVGLSWRTAAHEPSPQEDTVVVVGRWVAGRENVRSYPPGVQRQSTSPRSTPRTRHRPPPVTRVGRLRLGEDRPARTTASSPRVVSASGGTSGACPPAGDGDSWAIVREFGAFRRQKLRHLGAGREWYLEAGAPEPSMNNRSRPHALLGRLPDRRVGRCHGSATTDPTVDAEPAS